MKTIDLHTHSNRSDGSMEPRELVICAKEAGLSAIALTDHDNTRGVAEALDEGKRSGIEVIPGIELSVISKTETHIVGLFIDIENAKMKIELEKSLAARHERNEETAAMLRAIGFDVTLEEAATLAGKGLVGRGHFANLLTRKGYASSVKEAFELYLASGKPAYSSNHFFTDRQAIELIHEAGGIAIVAHPHLIKLPDNELEVYLKKLIGYGLDGMEGYYTDFTPEMQENYQRMAKRLSLQISGGTDFHGTMKPHIAIGKGTGNMAIPYRVLEALKEYAGIRY